MTIDEDTIPTFDYIIERLSTEYELAYVHLSEPFNDVSDLEYAETEIAKRYRPKYEGTLMINAGFDQEKANAVINDGQADLVSFGKLYLSNPDLMGRFREVVPTSDWDTDTFYAPGKEGYLDYKAKTRSLLP
jgi:N-ethylmaleimide reductase